MWRKDQCQAGEDGFEGITSLPIDSISRSQSPLPDKPECAITEALAYQAVKCLPRTQEHISIRGEENCSLSAIKDGDKEPQRNPLDL